MKKIYSLLLAAAIASSHIVPISAETIDNIKLKFEEGYIEVTASAETAGGNYAVTVVKKGTTAQNPDDVFALTEVKSSDDKTISCRIVMPEEKNGNKTDGRYTVSIKGRDSQIAQCDFDYVTEDGKKAASEKLMTASEAELAEMFKADSEYRAALTSCGLVFDNYDTFTDGEKTEAHKVFAASRAKDTLAEDFNLSAIVAKVNTAAAIDTWLEKSELEFEGTAFKDSAAKDFVQKQILAGRKYKTVKEFKDMYELANILYLVNKAGYSTIGDVITKYHTELGLDGNTSYTKYTALSASGKLAADEALVLTFSKKQATAAADVASALADAVSGGKQQGGTSGGTSGTSGSSSGTTTGSGIAIGTSTPVVSTPAAQEGFIDLTGFAWAEGAINALYKKNVIAGVGDNKFDPYGKITREAFVKMIVAAKNKHDSTATSDFSDVESGSWYESYVASAARENIVSGIGDKLFGVGCEIKRQDAAVIIARCLGVADVESDYTFADDADISDYARQAVYNLYAAKIVSGTDNGNFDPMGSLTRAQAAVMINNMLNYVPASNTTAAETTKPTVKNENKIKMLLAFGFLSGVDIETFDGEASMPAQKFINAVASMVSGSAKTDSEATDYARSVGIIDTGFDTNGAISFDSAAEILVGVLGYGKLYADKTPFEAATAIGLLSGVNGKSGKALSMNDGVVMLCNALEIPLITIDEIKVGEVTVSADNENTILSVYHSCYEIEGIITANEYTSIASSASSAKDSVEIDGIDYLVGSTGAEKLIGKRIKGWAYIPSTGSADSKLVYIEEYKNKTVEIEADLIEDINESNREITYLEEENSSKEKTFKISPVVKVLYNGKVAKDFSYDDFDIASGRLVLIDNNNDGVAEVVYIEEYKFIVIDSVSYNSEAIYNIYSTPSSQSVKTDDSKVYVYLNGEVKEYTDLPEKSVAAITASRDGEIITIEASDKKISGSVKSINNNDNKITVDGVEYKLSPAYLDAKAANDAKCAKLELNSTYNFYLDIFGDIAYAEKTKGENATAYKYVYATKFKYEDGSIDETCAIRAMNTEGNWETIDLADKVKYNGASGKTPEDVFNLMGGADFERQLLEIKTNSDGEITQINTAEERTNYVDSDFNKRSNITGTWVSNNFSFSSKLFASTDTKVFRIPENAKAAESDYSVTNRSMFSVDYGYTFTAYNVDNYNYAEYLVLVASESVSSGGTPFLVANVSKRDVDGDIVQTATGILGESDEYTVYGAEETTFDGVVSGDLIQMLIGANGRAKKYEKLFEASRYGEKINPSEINKSTNSVAGFVTEIDRSGERVKINNGADGGQLLLKSDATVVLYDAKKNKTEAISFAEIEKGDYLYAYLNWSKVKIMYIIRK